MQVSLAQSALLVLAFGKLRKSCVLLVRDNKRKSQPSHHLEHSVPSLYKKVPGSGFKSCMILEGKVLTSNRMF